MSKPQGQLGNRLKHEKSPYLLQHAHNPVDWYPWGQEAFERARRENKPIFLSVGYSTCHWCHVMAHESFEDAAVAAVLNQHYVAIKVDREERPDVDRVYMTYVQATTGSGGWPMSVWLTPDLKPFLGGTYFPPEDRWGRPGFRNILLRVAQAWATDPAALTGSAGQCMDRLRQLEAVSDGDQPALTAAVLDAGYRQIKAGYEPRHGGFSQAPKFPHPAVIEFMLRQHASSGTRDALDMSLFSLRQMADGGIHDVIGGGFHRYSVDVAWQVPHFEKMLYDQAQLAGVYLDAFQITRDPFYAAVARDVLDYVLRDLTAKDGRFYSAEDADSPVPGNPDAQAEGAFYIWDAAEIDAALGHETAAIFAFHYGIEPDGNVSADCDPHCAFRHKNIPIVRHALDETARHFGQSTDAMHARLVRARAALFEVRARRPRPYRDDKTLTAWNGLAISAFARADQVFDEPRYRQAARTAAAFIETAMFDARTGRLLRRYRDGDAAIPGFADDYAFLIQGLIDLYETDFDPHWLTWAMRLQHRQDALFWDHARGGYFNTTGTDASVILRTREEHDGAEPSPNSVAAHNLLRLSRMTGNAAWSVRAENLFKAFAVNLRQAPHALPRMLVALGFQLAPPRQIVIAGHPDAPDTRALVRAVHARFIPHKVLLQTDGVTGAQALAEGPASVLRGISVRDGKATAYICENFVCRLPITDPAELACNMGASMP